MRVKKYELLLLLIGIGITGCSSMYEGRLVGQWQSKGPKQVRLNITKAGTNGDGFHQSYSSTTNGQTYTNSWRIESGNTLVLQDESFWGDFASRTGNDWASKIHYRIIELTSDRLVIQFQPVLGNEKGEIQEFQRIR